MSRWQWLSTTGPGSGSGAAGVRRRASGSRPASSQAREERGALGDPDPGRQLTPAADVGDRLVADRAQALAAPIDSQSVPVARGITGLCSTAIARSDSAVV